MSRSPPDIQNADAFGAIALVSAEGEKINPPVTHINWHAAERLGSITMHQSPGGVGDLHHSADGLNRADLIVCGLDTDEKRVGANCFGEGPEVEETIAVHGKLIEHKPLP